MIYTGRYIESFTSAIKSPTASQFLVLGKDKENSIARLAPDFPSPIGNVYKYKFDINFKSSKIWDIEDRRPVGPT